MAGWKAASGADPDDLQAQIAALQAQVQTLLSSKTLGVAEDQLQTLFERFAEVSAQAHERAVNPSNRTHPGISVYSYPEGDAARPKPQFKTRMFWAGYELDESTTTVREIELLNQMTPGEYTFRRADGSTDILKVNGLFDTVGRPTRLMFEFETRERRETLPTTNVQTGVTGMEQMLLDALGRQTPEQEELAKLRQEIESLRAAPVAS